MRSARLGSRGSSPSGRGRAGRSRSAGPWASVRWAFRSVSRSAWRWRWRWPWRCARRRGRARGRGRRCARRRRRGGARGVAVVGVGVGVRVAVRVGAVGVAVRVAVGAGVASAFAAAGVPPLSPIAAPVTPPISSRSSASAASSARRGGRGGEGSCSDARSPAHSTRRLCSVAARPARSPSARRSACACSRDTVRLAKPAGGERERPELVLGPRDRRLVGALQQPAQQLDQLEPAPREREHPLCRPRELERLLRAARARSSRSIRSSACPIQLSEVVERDAVRQPAGRARRRSPSDRSTSRVGR